MNNHMSTEFLFSNLPIGLIIVDENTDLVDANEFIFKYFNKGDTEVKGKKFGNMFNCSVVAGSDGICGQCEECASCDLRQGVLAVLEQGIVLSDISLSHDFNLNGRTTTKWFTINASKVVRNEEQVALVAFTDITHIKEIEHELYMLGITDALTGLYNRRYIVNKLDDILYKHVKKTFPISIAMIDIDKFKNVNDTCGHQVGDKVLKLLSSILKKNTRNTDFVCRYGGEEFLVVFTNASSAVAKKILNRVAYYFERLKPEVVVQKLTFSGGLVTIKHEDKISSSDEYIKIVDELLYKAKENGRNRIESFNDL